MSDLLKTYSSGEQLEAAQWNLAVQLLQRDMNGGFVDSTGYYARPPVPRASAADDVVAFVLTEDYTHGGTPPKAKKYIWDEENGGYIPDPEQTEDIVVRDTRGSWPSVPKDTGGEARVRIGPDGETWYEITDLFCYAQNL